MPRLLTRDRPVLAFLMLLVVALLMTMAVVPGRGGGIVHGEEVASDVPSDALPSDEPPQETQAEESPPGVSEEPTPSQSQQEDGGTPAGSGVSVPLSAPGGTGLTLTFDQVDAGGTTSVTLPSEEPTAPAGFAFGEPPTYFEITTTASFSGQVTVCATFDPNAYADPWGVRLLHAENGVWVDITTNVYGDVGWVCGLTSSFSPFALAEPDYAAVSFFGIKAAPQINDAKAGDPIGIQFGFGGYLGLGIFADGSPSWQTADCASGNALSAPQAATAAAAFKYNANTGRYTYGWQTSKSWRKSCVLLTLTFRDGSSAQALFRFK